MSGNTYFEKKLKGARTFFLRWKGSGSELWELTISHKTLSILVRNQSSPGNLLIACIEPSYIRGPLRWSNCDLAVETITVVGNPERQFRVFDKAVGMEVVCGALEVKENIKLW